MTNRLASLLLLFACGCVLMAGPHPCHAEGPAAAKPADEASACHSQEPTAGPPAGPGISSATGSGCCGEHGPLCESLCQRAGIVCVAFPGLALAPVAEGVAAGCERSLPLFAQPIDHVPLA